MVTTLRFELLDKFCLNIYVKERLQREQNHSSADVTAWCSSSGEGGTTKTTLLGFSFMEEEDAESTSSLLEVSLTMVELGGRCWARCAWAQVEQTAERVRSSSLQSTLLCGQYTLLDLRLSISLIFSCFLSMCIWIPALGCPQRLPSETEPESRYCAGHPSSLPPLTHWLLHSWPGPATLIPGTASFPPKEFTSRPSPERLGPTAWGHIINWGPKTVRGPNFDGYKLGGCRILSWKPIN